MKAEQRVANGESDVGVLYLEGRERGSQGSLDGRQESRFRRRKNVCESLDAGNLCRGWEGQAPAARRAIKRENTVRSPHRENQSPITPP